MTNRLYFLSFRDLASSSVGVTAGEVYASPAVANGFDWSQQTTSALNWVNWDEVGGLFSGLHVCFVVHGFNVSAVDGMRSGGALAQEYEDLGNLGLAMTGADIVVIVLWPGDGLIGWDWFTAWQHSKDTATQFRNFLISKAFNASRVSFITHSLGARVVLETIDATVLGAGDAVVRFTYDTAVMMAAAIDNDALDTEFPRTIAPLERIVILSSTRDNVLKYAFTVGGAVEDALYQGRMGGGNALGRFGPKFAANSPARAKTEWYQIDGDWVQDHGDYMPTLSDGGWPNGWSDKRGNVGQFCVDVIGQKTFAGLPRPAWTPAGLTGWGQDRTAEFRDGWTPRM